MRCLLIGASGQLGQALGAAFADHDVVGAAFAHPEPGQLRIDLGDARATAAAVKETKADLVLIAGSQTTVDACETDSEGCFRVNAGGPAAAASAARARGAAVVFYSTDYVFDGAAAAYAEGDPVSPLNVYGRAKAEGEAAIREGVPERHLILRTSWVYGPDRHRRNFPLRLIDTLSRPGEPLRIPSDQWGCPTYVDDLAAATRRLFDAGRWGTFHATGPEFVDRATLARRICQQFALDEGRIVPTPTDELEQRARRPLRVRLDGAKLRAAGVPPFRDIAAGLEALRTWNTARATR